MEPNLNPAIDIEPKPAKRALWPWIIIFATVVVVGAGAAVYLQTKPKKAATSVQLSPNPAGFTIQNNYRIYQESISPDSYSTRLKLVDAGGKTVQTATTPTRMYLYTILDDGLFLLKEDDRAVGIVTEPSDDDTYGGSFWIVSKSGIAKASTQINKYLREGAGTQTEIHQIFPAGAHQVVFNSCSNQVGGGVDCSLYLLDILTGQRDKLPSKAVQTYLELSAYMSHFNIQVSRDRNELYILEPPKFGLNQKPINNDSQLLKYDFRADKITAKHKLTGLDNSYGRYWIAPDGQRVAYISTAQGGTVVDLNNKHSTFQLGPQWSAAEGWSGETTSTDPLWSPDSKKIAFTSYLSHQVGDETLALLDTETMKITTVAHHIGQQWGSGQISITYQNLYWLSNSQLGFNEVTDTNSNQRAYTYGANYLYQVGAASATSSRPSLGAFTGMADGSY